jgi:tripartite-type tricarboxylate transporter receptor subunit TctC
VLAAYSGVSEQINAGTMRALAVAARNRVESLPDVPTVDEAGYRDFELENWFGVIAPAKTSHDTVTQFAGWFTAAMRTPQIKAKLVAQGLYPSGICGSEFAALLRRQYDDYGRIIREAGIKAE